MLTTSGEVAMWRRWEWTGWGGSAVKVESRCVGFACGGLWGGGVGAQVIIIIRLPACIDFKLLVFVF